ncbi:outer membrane beta-barrel protein, partial [Shewanella sp. 10N.261.52.F9]|uniref:outer membrane beta-barrel protein n=1 Tax=Shewanella sp. 10N.261.52.F9 TaxID=3229684 RepID=UPI00355356FF
MKKSLFSSITIICFLSVFQSGPSNADESQEFTPFVGIKGGYQYAEDKNYQHSNPENYILGINAGVQFGDNWAWDIGFQDHDDLVASATDVNVSTYIVDTGLRYDWRLTDKIGLYGRMGVAYWNATKSFHDSKMHDEGFS